MSIELQMLLLIFAAGIVYMLHVTAKVVERKKEGDTIDEIFDGLNMFDKIAVITFGPFFLFIRRGIRKMRRR